jgi:hypothetical protein
MPSPARGEGKYGLVSPPESFGKTTEKALEWK